MKRIYFGVGMLLSVIFINIASAEEIVRNAVITAMANTDANTEKFSVTYTGGTGVCAAAGTVVFDPIYFPSSKVFDRAFALATVALTTGKKVRIYNYNSSTCDKATYIRISNDDLL